MTADLPMPKVAIIDTDMPNAFATGRSPRHAAVAVTTGLLRRLEPHELEGVLAHELSHVKHRDVAVMTIASFLAHGGRHDHPVRVLLRRWFGGGCGDDDRDSGQAFMIAMLVSIVVYAISFVLIRTLSRYREFAADRGACGADQVAVGAGLGAGQDLRRHGAHPAARPARGGGPEPVLHHPRQRQEQRSRASSPPTRRSRRGSARCAARAPSSRRCSRWDSSTRCSAAQR